MKRILSLLLFVCTTANAQFIPGQILTAQELNNQFALYVPITGATLSGPLTAPSVTGTAGSFVNLTVSGSASFPAGTITPTSLAAQGANTVLANFAGSSAAPAAFSIPSCSTGSSALIYTSGTGLGCNTSVNAATLGGATFAAPGSIGSTTPGSGAFTTLSASGTISGPGFSTYLASPPAIGTTAAAAGSFTTLNSTGGSLNGSIGATTPSTGSFTTLAASSTLSGVGFTNYFASPPAIGATAPNSGAFTTLSASSTVSGSGFSTYLASPPAIGATAANSGSFTTLAASSTVSGTGFTSYMASPPAIGNTTPNTGKFTTLTTTAQSKVIATTTNAQSIPNNALTTVGTWTAALNQGSNFNTSTGAYTTPAAGTYDVRFSFRLAAATYGAGNGIIAAVFNNGVEVYQTVITLQSAATSVSMGSAISAVVNCASGDVITVRAFQNSGGAVALDGNAVDNWVMITQMP
ncbi:hypothetical protein LMG22037_06649 [Paraburkholderia phenoliruptrix]|uniref:C1q domain-containing protein n=1 Tax=Paraburkholderia phenoliruptrix TaxID=252970 RepID=A0A6J5CUG6_9BURK|nr:hypothetical protein [Paraburkholderia phenoliruptrix]CAB3742930.1 hypothetical protein LMG22037_06649 [Paraburkholderia phenoliruptrix]